MKAGFMTCMLLTTHLVLASGNGMLTGRVTDTSEGAPVAQAYVLVHHSGLSAGDVHLSVKRDGSFAAELPPGFYDVFVTAVGFAPTASKIQVREGQTTTYNPRIGISRLESSETAGHTGGKDRSRRYR